MLFRFPFMAFPLVDSVGDFLDQIEASFLSGSLSVCEYYVALGKALGYVESQFSSGHISEDYASSFVDEISRLIQCL